MGFICRDPFATMSLPSAPPFPEGTYTLRSHKWSTTIYEDASGTILHGARPPAGDTASVHIKPLAAGPPGAYSIASSATASSGRPRPRPPATARSASRWWPRPPHRERQQPSCWRPQTRRRGSPSGQRRGST